MRHLHAVTPDRGRIAVTGCLATLQPAEATALPGVALVADNGQKDLLHTLLEPWSAELDDPADLARMQPDGNPFDLTPSPAPSLSGNKEARSRTRRLYRRCRTAATTNAPSGSSPLPAVKSQPAVGFHCGGSSKMGCGWCTGGCANGGASR